MLIFSDKRLVFVVHSGPYYTWKCSKVRVMEHRTKGCGNVLSAFENRVLLG